MTAPIVGLRTALTPDPTIAQVLVDKDGVPFDGASGTTVLPASQAWVYSEPMPLIQARHLALFFAYNAHASTTTGQVKARILGSCATVGTGRNYGPLFSDDSWFELPMPDDLGGTPAALVGALGTGFDATAGPLRNVRQIRGTTLLLPAAVANSDKIRQAVVLEVSAYRWVMVAVQEFGDATNRGILSIKASCYS